MTGQAKKIPLEAIVGLTLVAIAAFALFRTSGTARQDDGGQSVGEVNIGETSIGGASIGGASVGGASVGQRGQEAPAGNGADERPPAIKPDDVAVFMRAKLDHSRHVLEGLAMEDYQAIYRAAHDLALASQASTWEVLLTEEYARQSADFRRSCESLRTAARDENLDAAALAWMEVTLKCVQCHKYVRQADAAVP